MVFTTAPPIVRMSWRGPGSLVALLVVGVLLWHLPAGVGTSWTGVGESLLAVSAQELALLAVVWFVGLYCHTWVLTAALPGLGHGRALALNLGGSAVCNLVPFGAAAGAAVNLAMARSWNVTATRFATFVTVSNVWNVLAKLGLPAAVLIALLAGGALRSARLVLIAGLALAALVVLLMVVVTAVGSDRLATRLGAALDRSATAVLTAVGSRRRTSLVTLVPAVCADVRSVARQGWPQLTAGVASYLALQALLWWMCLDVLGNQVSFTAVLATFAVERVLSMLPFSPGGIGFAEAGAVAVLLSFGGSPVAGTAAVVLFRIFAFLLEIPVGGAVLAGWLWTRRRDPVS